ncbi:hypothetical protein A5893_09230 [Pedobacter psychrophilus]|uniref:Putative mRNA interferase YoeB n=1 Tax=Pedobacter psychrophilus TaxID=1826909 RepID=A0A179DH33_9SPHI|nr:Txe/YoeB family addiction module toxin [Pedobacter psychrophilus]OAQ39753.1 hypothetical protein A5893_09230 [Pedobacter psychrophilus]
MNLIWTSDAWSDYLFWQTTDKSKLKRLNELLKSIVREPYIGIGNPEPLKHDLKGCWSRRIDSEHRVVYIFENDSIKIISCRYHY